MPRRPRITEVGFHHIIARGVDRRDVFTDEKCFETFLSLLKSMSSEYKITIHAFCLMTNHYHILLETTQENLSHAIRKLNSSYATWFNATHARSGHLWQGRYLSYYIFDETHFWTVAKYIERNPIAAHCVENITQYPYQSYFMRLHANHPFASLIETSKILSMEKQEYEAFIATPLATELRKMIYHVSRPNKDSGERVYLSKSIASFFENRTSIRNDAIKEAYSYGYTKSAIAEFLGLSKMAITKILK